MVLYRIYTILNKNGSISDVSKKEEKIIHPRFPKFDIINADGVIRCTARDVVEMPYSTDQNIITGSVEIGVIISRYKQLYCIVGLSGTGLFSVSNSIQKYINNNILIYIRDYLHDRYDLTLDFSPLQCDNNHFSTKYWGDNITTKSIYNSSIKVYIKLTSSDLNNLFKENPDLNRLFLTGSIRSIKGKNKELDYILDNERRLPGNFKFDRNGFMKCDFDDLDFLNNFLKSLIDKGFLGGLVFETQ
jgi:hypothetical protein